jgi:hypothetical protein
MTATAETVVLTKHAVERYRDRVRPGLGLGAAEMELGRLALFGEIVAEPPAWFARGAAQRAPSYLLIADLVLPLQPASEPGYVVATTCLAKGSISAASRERRTLRRMQRRSRGRTGPRPRAPYARQPIHELLASL